MDEVEKIEMESHWSAVFALTLGVSGLIIAEFLPVGVLTPMARDLGITEGMAGQAVSASAVFATVTSLLIAYVTRHLNRRYVLMTLTASLTLSSLIVALSPNFIFLLLGRVFLGIAVGGFWSMAAAIAIRLVPKDQGPKALATIFGGSSFSSVLAAPMGSFLGDIIGWRSVFLIAAIVGVGAFVWQWIALPSLKPLGKIQLRTLVDVLKIPQFLIAMVSIAMIFAGRFASFTFLRPFLESTTGLDAQWMSVMLLTFGLSYFVGNAFAPGMIRKNIQFAMWFPPIILTIIALGLLKFGSSFMSTFILIFLWGSVFGPVAPTWSSWVAQKTGVYAETGGGIYVAAIQGAAAIGAFCGGMIHDGLGAKGVFIFSGLLWFFSAVLIYFKVATTFKTTEV